MSTVCIAHFDYRIKYLTDSSPPNLASASSLHPIPGLLETDGVCLGPVPQGSNHGDLQQGQPLARQSGGKPGVFCGTELPREEATSLWPDWAPGVEGLR